MEVGKFENTIWSSKDCILRSSVCKCTRRSFGDLAYKSQEQHEHEVQLTIRPVAQKG